MVKLLFFARLREDLGTGAEDLALPAGVTTVAGLRTHLMSRGGAWASVLAANRPLLIAVNKEMAEPGTQIGANDEIAFMPPVTGG